MLETAGRIEKLGTHRTDIRPHRPAYEIDEPIRSHRLGIVVEKDENPAFGMFCGAIAQSRKIEWSFKLNDTNPRIRSSPIKQQSRRWLFAAVVDDDQVKIAGLCFLETGQTRCQQLGPVTRWNN